MKVLDTKALPPVVTSYTVELTPLEMRVIAKVFGEFAESPTGHRNRQFQLDEQESSATANIYRGAKVSE